MMDPFHERLAKVALAACGQYGFALAGGYAVQAAGILERPSEDVDLFTVRTRLAEMDDAISAVVAAFTAEGMTVDDSERNGAVPRLYVTDGYNSSKVEMIAGWRLEEPVQMAIGPVLHPDDAVGNKMDALFGRAAPKDFIDVDAAVQSGRYDRESLMALLARINRGFDRVMFGQTLNVLRGLPDTRFTAYGLSGRDVAELRARFADWQSELLT